jgi:hypothetical protein
MNHKSASYQIFMKIAMSQSLDSRPIVRFHQRLQSNNMSVIAENKNRAVFDRNGLSRMSGRINAGTVRCTQFNACVLHDFYPILVTMRAYAMEVLTLILIF